MLKFHYSEQGELVVTKGEKTLPLLKAIGNFDFGDPYDITALNSVDQTLVVYIFDAKMVDLLQIA